MSSITKKKPTTKNKVPSYLTVKKQLHQTLDTEKIPVRIIIHAKINPLKKVLELGRLVVIELFRPQTKNNQKNLTKFCKN